METSLKLYIEKNISVRYLAQVVGDVRPVIESADTCSLKVQKQEFSDFQIAGKKAVLEFPDRVRLSGQIAGIEVQDGHLLLEMKIRNRTLVTEGV